jgi:hypothetical protein
MIVLVCSNSEITTVGKHHSLVRGRRLEVSVVVVVSVLHCGAVLEYFVSESSTIEKEEIDIP